MVNGRQENNLLRVENVVHRFSVYGIMVIFWASKTMPYINLVNVRTYTTGKRRMFQDFRPLILRSAFWFDSFLPIYERELIGR